MGWLIVLAVLVLTLLLPLGVSASYDSGGAKVSVAVGFVRIPVYPRKKSEKSAEKPKEPKSASGQVAKKSGGPVTDFIPLVKLVLKLLDDFRGKLRVNLLELNVILGGGDPCDLAQNYGKACAALGNLWPRLERFLVIQKRDVKVQCDFEAEQTLVTAKLLLTITVARVFSLGIRHGFKILKEFLTISKKRKGGA